MLECNRRQLLISRRQFRHLVNAIEFSRICVQHVLVAAYMDGPFRSRFLSTIGSIRQLTAYSTEEVTSMSALMETSTIVISKTPVTALPFTDRGIFFQRPLLIQSETRSTMLVGVRLLKRNSLTRLLMLAKSLTKQPSQRERKGSRSLMTMVSCRWSVVTTSLFSLPISIHQAKGSSTL